MNDFSFVLSATVAFLSAATALSAALNARRALGSLRARLRSLELRIESLAQSAEETQSALTDVANRVKMQRVRNAANHVGGSPREPDPYRDPDGWRKAMNRQLSQVGKG